MEEVCTQTNKLPDVSIAAFDYELPVEAIAQFPHRQRDQSRLLIANPNQPLILHDRFQNLDRYLPSASLLVRNVTKVIPARLFLRKATGGRVEVFCLEAIEERKEKDQTLYARWRCLLRGKRLRVGTMLFADGPIALRARIIRRHGAEAIVEFQISAADSFEAVLLKIGQMPIPPYLRRQACQLDRQRYQTIYAQAAGSVAAPTAGLHFTDRVLDKLRQKQIGVLDIVLHVGAGTFLPIKGQRSSEHIMHWERGIVTIEVLRQLYRALANQHPIIAVGTTSLRLLESLYWIGWQILNNRAVRIPVAVPQSLPYEMQSVLPTAMEAITAVRNWMEEQQRSHLELLTQLFILPGYRFQMVDALVTNFHQPRSTLLLLVAAFVGDFWRSIYQQALERGYRFLSYGDASLLWRFERKAE